MKRTIRANRRIMAAVVGLGLAALVGAPVTRAAEQSEVQRGAAILGAVENGQQECAALTSHDLEAVGEFAMQRMVGSAQAHEAMDRAMTQMMGASGLDSMHRYLGQRFSGCARGPAPSGVAGIAGMMGMMGGAGRGYGPGMMGQFDRGGAYGGGMMGDPPGARTDHHGDGWSSGAMVAAILISVLLLLVAGAVAFSWRRSRTPATDGGVEILDRRFASGEIDSEEYQRLRAALGGADR